MDHVLTGPQNMRAISNYPPLAICRGSESEFQMHGASPYGTLASSVSGILALAPELQTHSTVGPISSMDHDAQRVS